MLTHNIDGDDTLPRGDNELSFNKQVPQRRCLGLARLCMQARDQATREKVAKTAPSNIRVGQSEKEGQIEEPQPVQLVAPPKQNFL